MEIYVLNRDYEPIYCLDEANSVLWHKKYKDVGEAEIYVSCNEALLDVLKVGYYLKRYDDDMICEISKRNVSTSLENGDFLTVKAKDIVNIFKDRVLYEAIDFTGTFGEYVKTLINSCYAGTLRTANIELDESNLSEFDDIVNIQLKRGTSLLIAIKDVFNAYEYGFRLTLEEDTFIFKMYKGVDRSTTSAEVYVEFSNNYANMLSSDYEEDYEAVKNVAYIVGAYNETLGLTPKETINSFVGLKRKELYVDCTNLSWEYEDENGVKHTYSEEEYRAIMRELGRQALASATSTKSFTGEVDTVNTYEYKIDYGLGDIVKVVNDYGISSQARIQEILEADDEDNGYNVELTLNYKGVD